PTPRPRAGGVVRGPGSSQRAPGERRNNLTGRFLLPPRDLLGGPQDVVVDIEGGAHASDANASRISDQVRRHSRRLAIAAPSAIAASFAKQIWGSTSASPAK